MYIVIMRTTNSGVEFYAGGGDWLKYTPDTNIKDYRVYSGLGPADRDIYKFSDMDIENSYYTVQLGTDKNGDVTTVYYG